MNSSRGNGLKSNKLLLTLQKLNKFVKNTLFILSSLSILAILIFVLLNVVLREFFNNSLLWSNDLSGYLLVYLAFLSAPILLIEGGHVNVDLISDNLKGNTQLINKIIIDIVTIISMSLFGWFALEMTIEFYNLGTVMMNNIPWPRYLLMAPIALGSILLVIYSLINLVNSVYQLINKNVTEGGG